MFKRSPKPYALPSEDSSTTAIVKLSVFNAPNVAFEPVDIVNEPPDTSTTCCLLTWIESHECVLTQSLGHANIDAVWSWSYKVARFLVTLPVYEPPAFPVSVSVVSSVTLETINSSLEFEGFIIISPSFNSVVNFVAKPVTDVELFVNVTVPSNVLLASISTFAVNVVEPASIGSCDTPLARSML